MLPWQVSSDREWAKQKIRVRGRFFIVLFRFSIRFQLCLWGDESIYFLSLTYHHITVEAFLVNCNSIVVDQLHLPLVLNTFHTLVTDEVAYKKKSHVYVCAVWFGLQERKIIVSKFLK